MNSKSNAQAMETEKISRLLARLRAFQVLCKQKKLI